MFCSIEFSLVNCFFQIQNNVFINSSHKAPVCLRGLKCYLAEFHFNDTFSQHGLPLYLEYFSFLYAGGGPTLCPITYNLLLPKRFFLIVYCKKCPKKVPLYVQPAPTCEKILMYWYFFTHLLVHLFGALFLVRFFVALFLVHCFWYTFWCTVFGTLFWCTVFGTLFWCTVVGTLF